MPAQPIDSCPHAFPPSVSRRAVPAGSVPFTVNTARLGTTALVHLGGEVDAEAEPAALAALARATSRPYHLLALMLGDITFFACCGLNLVLRARQDADRHGASLALIAPSRPVRRLLDVTDLTGAFTIHADLADALAGWTARS